MTRHLKDFVTLMRPYQWWKNGFTLLGLIFINGWSDSQLTAAALTVFLAFCLASSSVYIVNDIMDVEADRAHEKKKHRPIASKRVSSFQAALLATVLFLVSLSLSAWVSKWALFFIISYMILNLLYTYRLKRVVLLDVFCIATGFMLRIFAGTKGIGIHPSEWLLLCSLMLTLFLGFTKRRAEKTKYAGVSTRAVLEEYDIHLLDILISVTTAGTILTYGLYTLSESTIQLHHTNKLIATIPFVAYGLFRYLYLVYRWHAGQDPAEEILKDRHILLAALGWLILTVGIFNYY